MSKTEITVVSLIATFIIVLLSLVIHSETKDKQFRMEQLGFNVTYIEAFGTDNSFIEGVSFERAINNNQ
jgi:uncharacterized membrane protein